MHTCPSQKGPFPIFLFCLALSMLVFFPLSGVQARSPENIPEPLKPWVPWVQEQDRKNICPQTADNTAESLCIWPGPLSLELEEKGGHFTIGWDVLFESAVPLPGDAARMPRRVRVNGREEPVLLEKNRPVIYLKPGSHIIKGEFAWSALPDTLSIPPEISLIRVEKNQKAIHGLQRDTGGRLWLKARPATGEGRAQGHTEMRIFRKLQDGHPLELETRIQLAVSGSPRQERLAVPMPEKASLVFVESPLPLKPGLEEGLVMDLRPGNFTIRLVHLLSGSDTEFRLEGRREDELWVFIPAPELRAAEFTGGQSVDPRQTPLPDAWKRHAAYRMAPDASPGLVIRETLQQPPEDRLRMKRDIWLDFDGKGATVRDQLTGTLNTRRYMGMDTKGPLLPGRMALNEQDRMITVKDSLQGIELPPGPLSLTVLSRMDGKLSGTPLPGGWQHRHEQTDITLHLPPGWHLAGMQGGKTAMDDSFTSRWTLLDVFFLVMLSGVALRIWGTGWGLGFGLAIALFHHSFPLPLFFWFGLAATAALGKYASTRENIPAAGLVILSGIHVFLLLTAGLVALPYAADQIRTAIYPQLERLDRAPSHRAGDKAALRTLRSETMMQEKAMVADALPSVAMEAMEAGEARRQVLSRQDAQPFHAMEAPAKAPAVTQTGPGVPDWQWRSIPVHTGLTGSSHSLVFYLIPPLAASLAALLRVGFVLLVLGRLAAGFPYRLSPLGKTAGAFLILLLFLPATGVRAEFPPEWMLEDLKKRMQTEHLCDPHCARSGPASLVLDHPEAENPGFALEMEIHAGKKLAFPIPATDESLPSFETLLNGEKKSLLLWRGKNHIPVDAGIHTLRIQGSLPENRFRLNFPLPPDSLVLKAPGWNTEGLDAAGRVRDSLTFTPAHSRAEDIPKDASPELKAFVQVKRIISRDRYWQVRTEVSRPYPGLVSGSLRIPLIPDETVISDGFPVRDGHVEIPIPGHRQRIAWESRLPEEDSIRLFAAETLLFSEQWEIHGDTDRHLSWSGTPAAPRPSGRGLVWTPLPGESLTLSLTAMEPAPGPTRTAENVLLKLEDGRERRRLTMEAAIRSGKAFLHPIKNPEGATIKEIRINGELQPLPGENEDLLLPLTPGTHRVQFVWEMEEQKKPLLRPRILSMPKMDMAMPTANITQEIHLDKNQWLLWTYGPLLGPGVRIWGWIFLVLTATALLSFRPDKSPLRTRDWLLLGLGLVSLSPFAVLIVGAGFFIFDWRSRQNAPMGVLHNLWQCGLGLLLVTMALLLLEGVRNGLLGIPDMQIAGNGSHTGLLRWTADRSEGLLPSAGVFTMPLFFWRLLMFAWALWLAGRVLSWAPWAWQALMTGSLWQKKAKPPADTGLRLDIDRD
ncbi:hypothetical protein LZ24_00694 [Desulfobotulus alkaliphilus]|uniref:Uncharacterized protein n=1 Tax=Desulfobotulus alkaliphilus TaxID=622671 RepID=A0A562S378_9BACT|nr:hypothetical protein [Desulfobotulus alkaliphilus]TWI75643.1 hypothetical protein LZ24_00694 [Desulfobotulus alkaliphilus]